MKQNITIVDIAKEAAVSISTVSRVLTGTAKVSEEKRARVEQAIKKYDFHPNALARGLIQSKTGLIGILAADIRNPYYSSLFVSCERAASFMGFNLMLCNSFGDRLKEFSLLEDLARQRVDAIIQLGGASDDLVTDSEYADKVNTITATIPVLTTGRLDGTNCPRINIDSVKAMSLTMEYIASHHSFKHIAFVGGSTKVLSTVTLRSCFKRMAKQLGLEYDPDLDVPNGHYDDSGGYETMNKILSRCKVPDIVIAVNDFTAIGIMRSIKEHNLRIPEDISIISFDNTFIATMMSPQLTAISYNYWSYGATIMDIAKNMIQNNPVKMETLIEPKFIVRQSCREF
ncbi:MAG: LacI family DNA-binding transcriptional regulator [Treponema sp.]|nr:LacI family DNA-binding transcriptional regulator [Treponema sp.]